MGSVFASTKETIGPTTSGAVTVQPPYGESASTNGANAENPNQPD